MVSSGLRFLLSSVSSAFLCWPHIQQAPSSWWQNGCQKCSAYILKASSLVQQRAYLYPSIQQKSPCLSLALEKSDDILDLGWGQVFSHSCPLRKLKPTWNTQAQSRERIDPKWKSRVLQEECMYGCNGIHTSSLPRMWPEGSHLATLGHTSVRLLWALFSSELWPLSFRVHPHCPVLARALLNWFNQKSPLPLMFPPCNFLPTHFPTCSLVVNPHLLMLDPEMSPDLHGGLFFSHCSSSEWNWFLPF